MKEEIQNIIQAFFKSSAGYLKVTAGGESLELNKRQPHVEGAVSSNKTGKPSSGGLSPTSIASKYVGHYRVQKAVVEKGMKVDTSSSLGFIDSMGISHQVSPPASGRILELHVKDGDVVEFGQPLFSFQEDI